MRICTGAWKSCFLPPSAPALCCRQPHGPWGSRGWDFLGLPVFPGPTRLICVQPQDCRILVRPLHIWPICMSCSRGFFSCPGELWPLFLTISLLASVPWPACPSRAGYPCVSQSACGSLSSPLPPVPLPDVHTESLRPKHMLHSPEVVFKKYLYVFNRSKLFCGSGPQPEDLC